MQVIQVGLNTTDMLGTLRLYAEVFGFQNSGCTAIWGDVMRVQGLETDARSVLWWMVGRQEFFQFDICHHETPQQRPKPSDWRPCDIGWMRMGIRIGDLDDVLAKLAQRGVALLGGPATIRGSRRVALSDPFVGIVLELIEDLSPEAKSGPAIDYVTSSVSDLEGARSYYCDLLGLTELDGDTLHSAEDESLWGLGGATREAFVVEAAGEIRLEIVHYIDPVGRAPAADHCIVDEGIMNVALGSHDTSEVSDVLDRVQAAGYQPPKVLKGDIVVAYVVDRERELEFLGVPEAMLEPFGFVAQGPFLGSAEV